MRLTKSYNERPITHNPCSCGFQRLVGLGFRLGFGICIRRSSDCNWQQVLLRSNQRLPYRQIGVLPTCHMRLSLLQRAPRQLHATCHKRRIQAVRVTSLADRACALRATQVARMLADGPMLQKFFERAYQDPRLT